MIVCNVCGKEFEPKIENHYESRDNLQKGLAKAFADQEPQIYDTFDCPYCGSQYVAQPRKRAVVFIDFDCPENEGYTCCEEVDEDD